jgi:transposase
VTTATLLAKLPELGELDCRQIAALVGVCALQSRKWNLERQVHDCRRSRLDSLSTAHEYRRSSSPQSRSEGVLRAPVRGKTAKQALTACMRKLLVILNAMPRRQTHRLGSLGLPALEGAPRITVLPHPDEGPIPAPFPPPHPISSVPTCG